MKKNFRKPICILLSLVMLLSVASVVSNAATRTSFGIIDFCPSDNDTAFVRDHQQIIEKIYNGLMEYKTEIDVSSYNLYTADYVKLRDAVLCTYPELFFVDNIGITYNTDTNQLNTVNPFYEYKGETADAMLENFYQKADWYLSMIDDGMDDFTKALVLHDALAINNYYCIETEEEYSSNYTFMVKGWGRCANYAEVYSYLLAQLGIKSEIVVSKEMTHEWMRINLDGSDYYYNIDLTWDDPQLKGADKPGKVSHTYFLLSDEQFQSEESSTTKPHHHYTYSHISDDEYDGYDNLHTQSNPFFWYDGELYTLYTKNKKGYIATYDHESDTYTDKYQINDLWAYGNYGYWNGNYSGFCVYNGMLCFNGENCVYSYDPSTNSTTTLLSDVFDDGNQLYGLYTKDGKLYGSAAATPNDDKTSVDLARNLVYKYNVYDDSAKQTVEKTTTKFVKLNNMTNEQVIELYMPSVKNAYLEYSGYTFDESGDTLTVNINDSEKKYTVCFDGEETEYSYLDVATLSCDEERSFIVDGRVVFVGKSYSFYVGSDTVVTTDIPKEKAEYAFIDLNSVTVTDEKVSLDMLATANVNTYKRMGVAFALSEKSESEIQNAVSEIASGSGAVNKIFVHNSSVDMYNSSGQYQFRYVPYFARNKAKESTIYFYTFVETEDGTIKVSDAAQYDMRSLLA